MLMKQTKIQVLRSWLSPKLASEEEAALFIKYLQLVSEDGQYAIVQTVGRGFRRPLASNV